MSGLDGFDATERAIRNAHGPCHDRDCPGALRRVRAAHGSDVYECAECGITTTSTAVGN